jgi:hypothetical protein
LATLNLNSNGVANYTTGTLTVGTHALSAAYQGDASFNAVTSPTVNITIAKGTPWMTLDDNSFGQIIAGNDFTVPVLVNSYGTAASGTVAVTLQSTTQTLTLNATLSTFNAPPNFMPYGLQAGAASVTFKAVPAGVPTPSARPTQVTATTPPRWLFLRRLLPERCRRGSRVQPLSLLVPPPSDRIRPYPTP